MITTGGGVARAPTPNVVPILALGAAVVAGAAVARGYELVLIIGLVAALYAMLFARAPALALVAYVATRPAVDAFVLADAGPVTVGQVWGAGLLVVVAVYLLGTGSQSPMRQRMPLPILALIALYGVFAIRGDSAITVEFGLKLALWLLLVAAVERIAQTREGQALCFKAGYVLAFGTAVLIGILIATNSYGAAFYESFGASQDTEQSPIPLSYLALFSIFFPLIALLNRWSPVLSLALVGALTVEIVVSYVRTALVALIVIVAVYIFVAIRRGRATAFALAGAFGVTAYVVQDRLGERFADLSLLGSPDASGAGSNRVAIWDAVWERATSSVESILAGGGAGTSHAISDEVIGHYVDAHNDLLEFFATGGVALALAYAVFLGWAVVSIWRVYSSPLQSSRARSVAAVAFGLMGAFVVVSSLTSVTFYSALVGFALALGLIRGMAATPGATCFDAAEPNIDRSNDHGSPLTASSAPRWSEPGGDR